MVQILRSNAPDWTKGNCAGFNEDPVTHKLIPRINPAETPDGVYPAEIFYSEDIPNATKEEKEAYDEAALTYCNGDGKDRPVCPMRQECLFFSLRNNEASGIWGGMLLPDRVNMRRFLPERNWEWHPPVPRAEDGTVLGGERPRKERPKGL